MTTRRGAGAVAFALACVLAALAVLGPLAGGATAAEPRASDASDAQSLNAVEALIAALGAHRAERAVDAIGHGLAMMEAQKRIAATERKLAKEAAATEAEAEKAAEAPAVEEVKDPSEMPPASAGTNGTTVPHSGGGRLFAHTRASSDGSTAILLSGIALAPPDAPEAVQKVINAANTIVGRPYVWGGGHASFYSYGYDCSGSVSFALFGGGLIPEPLTSGSLEGWGAPGPGKWITVYANAGHTFMEIAGLRWDTVGDARGTGPRWHLAPASAEGFVVRHPPGL
ncbi:MAG: C40 family peptidase [Actinobacteria bacterium]|nr:C40 family peptidase [Actinomycetota bacterium]